MRIHVGAAAIFDDKGRVLCCKRDSSSSHPGKWEFPGGKVEPDEKISDCIVRELNEELNLEIIPIRKRFNLARRCSLWSTRFMRLLGLNYRSHLLY